MSEGEVPAVVSVSVSKLCKASCVGVGIEGVHVPLDTPILLTVLLYMAAHTPLI
jgi:hypothetical protein